jgi:hypothetical protein
MPTFCIKPPDGLGCPFFCLIAFIDQANDFLERVFIFIFIDKRTEPDFIDSVKSGHPSPPLSQSKQLFSSRHPSENESDNPK